MVLFSIVDFGRLLHARLQLAEAAREGARAAALVSADQATATVNAIVGPMATSMTTPYDIAACPEHPDPGQDASVTLVYQFEFVTPLPFLSIGGDGMTLTQTAVMPCL